jgi:hypothetical protein
MTKQSTLDGKTIYLVTFRGCETCLGTDGSDIECRDLPTCTHGGDSSNDCWVDEEGFVKWLAEERMK